MAEKSKLTPVETFKQESDFLRGAIPQELVDGSDAFGKGSVQLLKHHGTYQQDNRDDRTKKTPGGKSSKAYSMMIRTAVPGGKLTPAQLLAHLDLCDELGSSTLRLTTRQAMQLHAILKSDLRETIQRINASGLSTLAACGDVVRNVMCCPAPHDDDPVHAEMQRMTDEIARHFAPRTSAYHEIWLKDPESGESELVGGGAPEADVEPIYGPTYLPRKFKIAVGLPGDNCVDMYTHDLALMAICENFQIVGYNMLVGGGFGTTPSADKTFPALAKRMAFVLPEQAIEAAAAVIRVQRDFGDRTDRKRARMKYLIADWGLSKFKEKVEEYYGAPLPEPHEDDVWGFDDHIGWRDQGGGKLYYGLNVENGRIADTETMQLKQALRRICTEINPGLRITSHQSLLFTDLDESQREPLEAILREHGVPLSEEISNVRRWSMACVALPTCGLAVAESERALPGVITQLETEIARLGLSAEAFTIRMTGCPNGCARPYNADVGLVGKSAGKYTVFLGGRLLGNRLNYIYQDLVPLEEITPTLVPVFACFKAKRREGETFGDFCARMGRENLLAFAGRFITAAAG